MTEESKKLLKELYRSARNSMEAAQMALERTEESPLRREIARKNEAYREFGQRTERMLHGSGPLPESRSVRRAVLRAAAGWASLRGAKSRPGHLARIMRFSAEREAEAMTRTLNRLDGADAVAKLLAEEYIAGERRSLEDWAEYP